MKRFIISVLAFVMLATVGLAEDYLIFLQPVKAVLVADEQRRPAVVRPPGGSMRTPGRLDALRSNMDAQRMADLENQVVVEFLPGECVRVEKLFQLDRAPVGEVHIHAVARVDSATFKIPLRINTAAGGVEHSPSVRLVTAEELEMARTRYGAVVSSYQAHLAQLARERELYHLEQIQNRLQQAFPNSGRR